MIGFKARSKYGNVKMAYNRIADLGTCSEI
jgi:hypothetical protein